MTLIIFGQITYDLLFLSLFIASILFFYKKEELLFSNDFYGKVWFFLVLQCNLFVWNVGVAVCLSKKKRNDYQCTTQHIITTKLLSWENCRKVYLQLSLRVVLCCTLLVQDISVRMRDVNTQFNHITLCVLFLNYWDRIFLLRSHVSFAFWLTVNQFGTLHQ